MTSNILAERVIKDIPDNWIALEYSAKKLLKLFLGVQSLFFKFTQGNKFT